MERPPYLPPDPKQWTNAEVALLHHFLDDYSMVLARRLCNDLYLRDTPENRELLDRAEHRDDLENGDVYRPGRVAELICPNGTLSAQDSVLLRYFKNRIEDLIADPESMDWEVVAKSAPIASGFLGLTVG